MTALSTDRHRRKTMQEVQAEMDARTMRRLEALAGDPIAIDRRLAMLDQEWDNDRVIEAESATTALLGVVLGSHVHRRFYSLTGFAASMVLIQSLTGWYPLLPFLRRLGVRTAREIERERYALRLLRGDFGLPEDLPGSPMAAVSIPVDDEDLV